MIWGCIVAYFLVALFVSRYHWIGSCRRYEKAYEAWGNKYRDWDHRYQGRMSDAPKHDGALWTALVSLTWPVAVTGAVVTKAFAGVTRGLKPLVEWFYSDPKASK